MNRKEETLLILMEECAEVAQAASKCIRFGGPVNDHTLAQEVGDLMCMIDILVSDGVLDEDIIGQATDDKREKLKVYSKIFEETL